MSLVNRAGVVCGIALYALAFNISYMMLVTDAFSDVGYGYHPLSLTMMLATYALCLVPAFWMPSITRPSILLFLSQYILIYIPCSFILHYSSIPAFDDITALKLQVVMLLGLSIMQSSYYIPLAAVRPCPLTSSGFKVLLAILVVVPLGYLCLTLGSTFRLTDFSSDNADFRYDQVNVASQHIFRVVGAYGEMWMAYILFPLLGAFALFCKKRSLQVSILLGYTLLYGLTAFRSQILAPAFILLVYLWTRQVHKYTWLFGALIVALVWPLAVPMESLKAVRFVWVCLWHMRTVCVQALEFGQYFEYYRVTPTTHFMHLNIFSVLGMSPPDSNPIAAVSEYFYGRPLGANANFWANDGLSSLGVVGIPILSMFCSALFWLLDSLAARFKLSFVLVWFAFLPVSFSNVSLFTNLLTGGFGLLILLLYVAPKKGFMQRFLRPDAPARMVKRIRNVSPLTAESELAKE
jgi:hypothetical protein